MIEALVLGVIQGLTEFLPVSSTAHLILLPRLFHWTGTVDTLSFDVALHAGTLCALLLFFRKDWAEMLTGKYRLLTMVIIASVPAGVAGFFLNDFVEEHLRNPLIISCALLAGSAVMLYSEKYRKERTGSDVNLADAVVIGSAQILALIPGVSRSGITISAGMFRHLNRDEAAKFSFLLSTPIVAGAAALHAREIFTGAGLQQPSLFLAGFGSSFVSGLFAIRFLLKFFRSHPVNIFVYYRVMLAITIISLLWFAA